MIGKITEIWFSHTRFVSTMRIGKSNCSLTPSKIFSPLLALYGQNFNGLFLHRCKNFDFFVV